jgi:dienelactone hydrolase
MNCRQAICLFSLIISTPTLGAHVNRELPVCGEIKEPLYFHLWKKLAADRTGIPPALTDGLESYQFKTVDRRVLRGYRLRGPSPAAGEKRTALLFLQGHTMLAEDVIYRGLRRIMSDGMDAFVLNYRGYGPKRNPAAKSDGSPRIEALIEDAVDFIEYLHQQEGYDRVDLVGVSLGGVIALNAVGRGAQVNRLVLDSVYSRISELGCRASLNPIAQKTPVGTTVLLISGGSDQVISPRDQLELRTEAVRRDGWTVVFNEEFQHPFTDPADVYEKRLKLMHDFLVSGGKASAR